MSWRLKTQSVAWVKSLTMSARWFSPSVKLCFPSEASWLCLSTSCMFFSHTALLRAISVWNKISDCMIWQPAQENVPYQRKNTIPPDYHNPCDVWFSTLPTPYLNQMKSSRGRARPKAAQHTKCAFCKGKNRTSHFKQTNMTLTSPFHLADLQKIR